MNIEEVLLFPSNKKGKEILQLHIKHANPDKRNKDKPQIYETCSPATKSFV